MLQLLQMKWKNRKRYTYSEMPDWLVVFFGLTSFIVAGYYTFILSKVVPGYLETANSIPPSEWGWKGWLLSSMLALLGIVVWHFGTVALRCSDILRDRRYK